MVNRTKDRLCVPGPALGEKCDIYGGPHASEVPRPLSGSGALGDRQGHGQEAGDKRERFLDSALPTPERGGSPGKRFSRSLGMPPGCPTRSGAGADPTGGRGAQCHQTAPSLQTPVTGPQVTHPRWNTHGSQGPVSSRSGFITHAGRETDTERHSPVRVHPGRGREGPDSWSSVPRGFGVHRLRCALQPRSPPNPHGLGSSWRFHR